MYPVLNPNSVLYLVSPEADIVDPFPLPPVPFFSRDIEPPVVATFKTDIALRPPNELGDPGAD
jgi:hypothetical protein